MSEETEETLDESSEAGPAEGETSDEAGFARNTDATAKVPSLKKNILLRKDAERHQELLGDEEE